jgi:hypothetical protein
MDSRTKRTYFKANRYIFDTDKVLSVLLVKTENSNGLLNKNNIFQSKCLRLMYKVLTVNSCRN